MTMTFSNAGASMLWIVLLTLASTATTLLLACATPFPALAALAAVHMRRADGLALMLLAWVASQAVGFCLLDYPLEAKTFAWGVSLATAAVAAVLAAQALLPRFAGAPLWARLSIAYVAAFAVFKAVVFLWALGLGGAHVMAAPAVMANQFVRNGAILIGLVLLHRGLIARGVPPARGRMAAA
ncbi:MAG: hypothetical protein V4618_01060 [Pseudomonadota bacterium]